MVSFFNTRNLRASRGWELTEASEVNEIFIGLRGHVRALDYFGDDL